MHNTISVDVEEYYHAANLERVVGPAKWHAMPSRIEISVQKTLELFADNGTRGTFFILGAVARRWPQTIRRIAEQGHEIASHGYGHRLAYKQTRRAFFRDVYRTKRLLEDLVGKEVRGYRAPNFSINSSNLWAYDELVRAGYRYDSSLYPIRHHRYGNRNRSRVLQKSSGSETSVPVIPLATAAMHIGKIEVRLPIAGGAYWRFLPLPLIRLLIARTNNHEQLPCHCYFHPWELDSRQPHVRGLSPITRLRHYGGISALSERVRKLFQTFQFVPIEKYLAEHTASLCQD